MSFACTALDQARKNVGAREESAQLRFSLNTLFKPRHSHCRSLESHSAFPSPHRGLGQGTWQGVHRRGEGAAQEDLGSSPRVLAETLIHLLAVSSEVVLGFRPHLSTLGCATSGRTKSHPKAFSIFQQAYHLVDSHNKLTSWRSGQTLRQCMQTASSLLGFAGNAFGAGDTCTGATLVPEERVGGAFPSSANHLAAGRCQW